MRVAEKEFNRTFRAFETTLKLTEVAVKTPNTKIKKAEEMKEKLEAAFYLMDESYFAYKADVLEKDGKTEIEFNSDRTNYPKNDVWSDSMMARYVSMMTSVEALIEKLEEAKATTEDKVSAEISEEDMKAEVHSERDYLNKAIQNVVDEVEKADKLKVAAAGALQSHCSMLKGKLETLMAKVRGYSSLVPGIIEFNTSRSILLDGAILKMTSKLDTEDIDKARAHEISSSGIMTKELAPKEIVHIEKSKPPRFKGEEIEYPDFKRKWQSIVSKARLPEETELDKLKDNLPPEAKDQIYGVKTMSKAWEILDKRWGDPKMIASKLKTQLKNVKCKGKHDTEKFKV